MWATLRPPWTSFWFQATVPDIAAMMPTTNRLAHAYSWLLLVLCLALTGLALGACAEGITFSGRASLSGGEWVMEGSGPQRNRATPDEIPPPLRIRHELSIGNIDTQFTSPVGVAGERVFADGVNTLHALSARDGQEQWRFNLRGSYLSPAIAGNTVFVRAESGPVGHIWALAIDSGAKLWQFQFPAVGSPYGNFGGHVTSPLVANGRVFVGAAQTFFALDAQTGDAVWTFNAQRPITSSAALADASLFFTDFSRLYALNIHTGEEQWHFAYDELSVSLFFAPIIAGDRVVVSTANTVHVLDRADGKLLWDYTFDSDRVIPAAATDGHIYVKTVEELFAFDHTSGELLWRYGAGDYISLPAVTGKQIYVVTRTGGSAQLRALQRTDGAEIWMVENPRLTNAAPVIAGSRVYVRTIDGKILVYAS